MSLGMVLHELATNAVKHGALGAADGQVTVGWKTADSSDELLLTWRESGGPHVTPPTTTSFGTKLISSTVSYSLRGTLEQDYAAGGLRTEIGIPLGKVSHPS
jgi:two-component sensor histidine kinase